MRMQANGGRSLERLEHNLYSAILYGVDGVPIELQARYFGPDDFGSGWDIGVTGMAKGAIREVVARVVGAFAKYGFTPPKGEILINLAPAGLEKYGTSLDLAIALISLQAAGYIRDLPTEIEKNYLFIGELSLHGDIRRVAGALPMALCAKPGNTLVVPPGNEKECCMVRGLPGHEKTQIRIAENLQQAVQFMQGKAKLRNAMSETPKYEPILDRPPDFSTIKGQAEAKRAMVIAAAGGHNVLMVGPPGEGKSLLASAFRGILPPLSRPEMIDLTRIYSAKGLLQEDGMVVSRRPFRTIHHSASKQALVGGGSGVPEPGEITLAHRGVLFLDEMPEFSRSTLESLRQPIESGSVTISRVDASLTFPSEFTLIAAMNPCPCGYLGQFLCQDCLGNTYDPKAGCTRCGKHDVKPRCNCASTKVQSYRKKISGPILDRIDLHVELRPLSIDEKFGSTPSESSDQIRSRVIAAREVQRQRFQPNGIPCNSLIPGGQIREWCEFSEVGFNRYRSVITQGSFSTRATDRMAKVARTIADLDRSPKIEDSHIHEAAEFLTGSPLL